jgi:hypothetical protein
MQKRSHSQQHAPKAIFPDHDDSVSFINRVHVFQNSGISLFTFVLSLKSLLQLWRLRCVGPI